MPRPKLLRRNFFARSVHAVAPDLIGATLLFKGVGGVIVEVEASTTPILPRIPSADRPRAIA